jgi:signal transduction histidine kinase
VLGNVLSNAIKYTPRGGAVDVLAECCDRPGSGPGEWVRITVQDNGPGIPVEQQGLLFQEYTRLGPDVAEGSGLGLAISRRIASALGGDLTFRSEHGTGSAFTLWLRLAAARRSSHRCDTARRAPAASNASKTRRRRSTRTGSTSRRWLAESTAP